MYKEINDADELRSILVKGETLSRYAFQDVDFSLMCDTAQECWFSDCIFLGGKCVNLLRDRMDDRCLVFPSFEDMPFNTFRNRLYNAASLYEGYIPGDPESYCDSFDAKVYEHYLEAGKLSTGIRETLARFLHDHSMNDAVNDFLESYDEKSIISIMGGHGLSRTEEVYRTVALISKRLTESGCLMVSGGGPGAMEATHLGAWMAGRPDDELDEAIAILSAAPSYKDRLWLDTAFRVMSRFPGPQYRSLGVPTWLYGHEPATPFASHIAKYFDNSTREDSILTIAKGGVIYSPGSAGTMQEIFQDAVQNHYLSFGYASPMIFLGEDYWKEEMPVYKLMEHLVDKGKYKNLLLHITDSPEKTIEIISEFRSGEIHT
jgi:predicted Rossmann-fold nucleotide-binding protein